MLIGGIVLASLTEAIASTVLSLGRGDIIGDTYATPDEFAWLDVCYTALKLIGFAFTPWLLTRVQPRNALLASTLVMGVACAVAAVTARLDVLILLRAVQGLAGAIAARQRPGHPLLDLSTVPSAAPAGPLRDGLGRRAGNDRAGAAGLAARQPVLDLDLPQRSARLARGGGTS